jgi:predicted proteasome-type protease
MLNTHGNTIIPFWLPGKGHSQISVYRVSYVGIDSGDRFNCEVLIGGQSMQREDELGAYQAGQFVKRALDAAYLMGAITPP